METNNMNIRERFELECAENKQLREDVMNFSARMAESDIRCAGLRAQLAERDALLRELDDAWNSHDGKERFGKLMAKVEGMVAIDELDNKDGA